MAKLDEFKKHLKEGEVYRRGEMAQWSNAIDRQISFLVKDGFLEKLSQGLYYVPRQTVFGTAPPDENILVRSFLKDDDFLITTPNAYNALGVGTTQLYNKRIVYNHKRHGIFVLGGVKFFFHARHRFPPKATLEFLLVDLVNNFRDLAEYSTDILKNVVAKAHTMPLQKLQCAVRDYGSAKAKNVFAPLFDMHKPQTHAE